ncbi:MAG: YeeE/YedE thiosulfate transporter family protein [Candidatus Sericytochromatia bacterium]|nr:YeeE/YedE thiosulfate transporter family protein [Candidatus Sericytochromatia bacterium]
MRTLRALPGWLPLGVAFGVLVALSVLLWGPIGVSSTYHRLAVAALGPVTGAWPAWVGEVARAGSLAAPETWLLPGLFAGGWLARRWRGPIPGNEGTPRVTPWPRRLLAGVLIVLGARMAGGCTSGHIISGISQQALSGVVFGAAVFGAAILTARLAGRSA